ncbi:tRNA uridine 5-carboxymethylaminomethyl modification enzyme MnmG [Mesoplasma sp. JKS002658]|uniref:tRNA uridine-5-carboxymethylaminomethyl(34) synthesis enzyme MnmG n=1 Tax=Mesoplasma whartonense TaxID=2878854 RepID=UPI002022A80A|nr:MULTISPECIES: tRNA uridine-5-carboxymethylaminomethyl(34) synthesis enzyme MnmG [unclassified Mesoplasma]MCL8211612.1 tRNA uridine 5-carboxymethylaminomethyl modification enzyme MnmG [Mesoplasma sp. JKS002664]MCL8212351.1 tRNA uridine 5-carboxymethylaminomethyl modification enzyme MnmG [Mesoplasma sp. JKS002662]MCL8213499.1 tRNA uridine 5-carboxymethylaminomethyl modification enzyme MnmG [Mesoplasma sp. JKS002660]MCL8214404.1 tRNA uridine 5-carboxymethylaminomethyl modification enzyme MnmG [
MNDQNYEVIVVGAGHAGVEAALSSAKIGKKTALINLYDDKIATMPCNPSIGGPAKGIVVREIDALGGEMGKAADATALQTKLLNSSRGPGVWALRVQSDKIAYSKYMENVVKNTPNLTLVIGAVLDLIIDEQNHIQGVILQDGRKITAQAVVLTTGTYLKADVLMGHSRTSSGPNGEMTTTGLSKTLADYGFMLSRFKTGTPPRVFQDSVDLSQASLEPGTDAKLSFSSQTKTFTSLEKQAMCYLIHSTPQTKAIVEANLAASAMYSGKEVGTGPRYCPSFEDKIVRFASKETHQIFIEPESLSLNTFYVQGFSTSMPIEVQDQMLRSLPGFANVRVQKWAYAIEYDCLDPQQLKPSLETKLIHGLFTAGQINGTSGYEEAAGQGLIAGINATRLIDDQPPLILGRDQAYIGVMIDDLITKGVWEPYRLLTSRAEHRLLLRNDNAEARLRKIGYEMKLVSQTDYEEFLEQQAKVEQIVSELKTTRFSPKSELAMRLIATSQAVINQGLSAYEILKQPKVDLKEFEPYFPSLTTISDTLAQSIVINCRFEGYVENEKKQAARFAKLERKLIPTDLNYELVANLATEARQKLMKVRPFSIGQASRITGVNPADIQMLLFYLKNNYALDQKTYN